MRNPPRKEERRPGGHRIGGVDGRAGKEVTRVVECHDDHQEAAKKIDGGDTAERRGGSHGEYLGVDRLWIKT